MAGRADIARFRVSPFSWMNFCIRERVPSDIGDVSFAGFFNAPEIPARSADIEIRVSSRKRVDQLALEYYGEQTLWWVIAQRNNLDLPLAELNEGEKVIIPDPAYVRETLVR